MNIRTTSRTDFNFYDINREERNFAAIFFAALCLPGNNKLFLNKLGIENTIESEFGVYFEYSYLRDLWSTIDDNETKKRIIKLHLAIPGIDKILAKDPVDINKKFGIIQNPSTSSIQFPGNWIVRNFDKEFHSNEDFLSICKFKWSFNIKPDIVIHINKNSAVCIEAKHISDEGYYPSKRIEKDIFNRREIKYVKQTELQDYMMKELLGLETQFIFLVSKPQKSRSHQVLSWKEAFDSLKTDSLPLFAQNMIARLQ